MNYLSNALGRYTNWRIEAEKLHDRFDG